MIGEYFGNYWYHLILGINLQAQLVLHYEDNKFKPREISSRALTHTSPAIASIVAQSFFKPVNSLCRRHYHFNYPVSIVGVGLKPNPKYGTGPPAVHQYIMPRLI